MISRRLLRIKALQILYAYYVSDQPGLAKAEKELSFSIDKTYELYHYLLLLLIEISDYAEERIGIARSKYFPTEKEANPNQLFVNNPVINTIKNDPDLKSYLQKNKISWNTHPELCKHLYQQLIIDPEYKVLMEKEEVGFKAIKDFYGYLITNIVAPNELMHQVLEEKSIFWNDDFDFAAGMTIKTLNRIKPDKPLQIFPKFKDEEDEVYVKKLFRKSIVNADEYQALIKRFTQNWEFERIAIMDILIMQLAIAEATEFPSIPTKVTFNEFIEIAKYYSTEKSSTFINGVLDKTFNALKEEKKIIKKGRGLVGEQS